MDTALQAKPDKILSKVCPDIRLANKRIAKLKTRKTYETHSIATSKGANAKGAPGGKNKLKKCRPFFKIPKALIPKKMANAIEKVTIK
jgi:hypothetical protein